MHDPHMPFSHTVSGETLFSVRGLSYSYPDNTRALASVNLEIAKGDRLALVGHNGSGKTTLMKHLCGLLMPSHGKVFFQERLLEGENLDDARLKIALLFQDPDDQLFGHTVLDDAAFGPRHQGLTKEAAEAAALGALKQVHLEHMAYKAPHNLSFGQKKRAALAGLLAMKPEVLLLDEPTTNLDPSQEQVFLDLLKSFSGTIVCISHDLIFLYDLCHRAIVMEKGEIHHDYSMKELVSQKSALRGHGLDFSFRMVLPALKSHSNGSEYDKDQTIIKPAGKMVESTLKSHSKALECDKDQTAIQSTVKLHTHECNRTPLLHLKGYSFYYPDGTAALNGIDFKVDKGEKIALVGENGAGKTTLLSSILGLQKGKGEFFFDGMSVTRKSYKKLWQRVGMVFQDCADQLFCPSVDEEITFGLRQLDISLPERVQRMQNVLSMVHLEGFEKRVPLNMSGGERKRLALACVLAMEPEIVILDEPTAGLDPQGEELMLEIIRRLDATLLLVSHDMFFVGELTNRTVVMHRGKIVENLTTHEFMKDERLGNLNGLAYAYRRESTHAIQMLQHEHEHSHLHHHLHSHIHRHGDVVHEHFHEHAHEHPHRFVHTHPGEEKSHHHAPRRYHDHQHPDHESETHDHMHD
ncbi:conserved hypothetical protein [Desulfamplus magnetovallimortis]|uniref:ABC transporter domain-containing protein n=1 Tax=Desulfamplus magnetovallimortis TaxID=1246637 RepID=A0A1W1HBA4_9BACT|nr:energy-coupling factor transporter ATPase [Desulfamplus magnetovallimortis]SLM29760.1 conserved hypothetical protein [Desulfamplus magnetovallimortis]